MFGEGKRKNGDPTLHENFQRLSEEHRLTKEKLRLAELKIKNLEEKIAQNQRRILTQAGQLSKAARREKYYTEKTRIAEEKLENITEELRLAEEKIESDGEEIRLAKEQLKENLVIIRQAKETVEKNDLSPAVKHNIETSVNRENIWNMMKSLKQFTYKLYRGFSGFQFENEYSLYGSFVSHILGINTSKVPNDIDILFYYNFVSGSDISFKNSFKKQLHIIFGRDIKFPVPGVEEIFDYSIDEKTPKIKVIFLADTKYQISIDITVTNNKELYERKQSEIKETSATSFVVTRNSIHQLGVPYYTPFDILINIFKGQQGVADWLGTDLWDNSFFLGELDPLPLVRYEKAVQKGLCLDNILTTGNKIPFECPILQTEAYNCPILSCGHAISFEGLIGFVKSKSQMNIVEGLNQLKCPLCREKLRLSKYDNYQSIHENIGGLPIHETMVEKIINSYSPEQLSSFDRIKYLNNF